LPDGRLQAVAAFDGNNQILLTTLRWLPNGAIDPDLPIPATTSLQTANSPNGAIKLTSDLDSVVLQDGSTLVAMWEPTQRILLRLDASGHQDMSFANAGTARIDGVVGFPGFDFTRLRIRIAVQADGKILLAYSTALSGGTALAVARFTANVNRTTRSPPMGSSKVCFPSLAMNPVQTWCAWQTASSWSLA
jgi:Domain of unknown function (DUF5122) beta-propeller